MKYNRRSSHTVYDLKVHVVWITKYRKRILKGELQERCKELLRQSCEANEIQILKGVVSRDHVHMHVSYPPKLSVSEMLRKLKGRSSKLLLNEYRELLKKTYWGGHFWGIGYGAWSTGNVTDDMIDNYLEHHRSHPNHYDDNFILE